LVLFNKHLKSSGDLDLLGYEPKKSLLKEIKRR
jgi:hypothetical protein